MKGGDAIGQGGNDVFLTPGNPNGTTYRFPGIESR